MGHGTRMWERLERPLTRPPQPASSYLEPVGGGRSIPARIPPPSPSPTNEPRVSSRKVPKRSSFGLAYILSPPQVRVETGPLARRKDGPTSGHRCTLRRVNGQLQPSRRCLSACEAGQHWRVAAVPAATIPPARWKRAPAQRLDPHGAGIRYMRVVPRSVELGRAPPTPGSRAGESGGRRSARASL